VYISKHRATRFEHIATYLAEGNHDLVGLQEVWSKDDYSTLKNRLSTVLPHSYYFYSGVIGSGLCIFSRWPIEEIAYEPFQVHGPPYKVWQGDWMAGKGVGMCAIRHPQHGLLHFFTTHTIAGYNYGPVDSHQSHRVCQAFQIVRFMKRYQPQYTIICGDFNAEPKSPTYNIISSYGQLNDTWLEISGSESAQGYTSNCLNNIYSPKNRKPHRIDYIFYNTDKNESMVLKCKASEVTMGQIPGTNLFYSDHSGVSAEFEFASRVDTDSSVLALEALPVNSLRMAEQLTSMGLQAANNKRQQQIIAFLFFFSMWITLTAFSWFPWVMSLISFAPVSTDVLAFSSPLVGILQSSCAVLALLFGLLSFVVTQVEISKTTQLWQEMKLLCETNSEN
jgi:sphingomyelin phosphodiesterase 2